MKKVSGALAVVLMFIAIPVMFEGGATGSKTLERIAIWIAMAGLVSFLVYRAQEYSLKETIQFAVILTCVITGASLIQRLPSPLNALTILLTMVAVICWAAIRVWLDRRKRKKLQTGVQGDAEG